jgi:thioredoxin 1
VEPVAERGPCADYGIFGAGSEKETASTPETGKSDKAEGAPASEGTTAASTETASGTEAGNTAGATEKPTYLIYFTATWCGPCRGQKPVIEQIQAAGKHKVYIVDIDKDPASANAWGVSTVPTVATVVEGKTTYRGVGAGHTREFLESKLEK